MNKRLIPLYIYLAEIYKDYEETLLNISSSERRVNFVLEHIEKDIESLNVYKKQLYNMKPKLLGTTISYISCFLGVIFLTVIM